MQTHADIVHLTAVTVLYTYLCPTEPSPALMPLAYVGSSPLPMNQWGATANAEVPFYTPALLYYVPALS